MGKDLISFPDLVGANGAIETLCSSVRKAAAPSDKFAGKNIFKARVLRAVSGRDQSPKDVQQMMGIKAGEQNRSRGSGKQAYYVMVIEDHPHAFLPNPCFQGDEGLLTAGQNKLVQGTYTTALWSGEKLDPGDDILVRFEHKDFSYDTDICYVMERLGSNIMNSKRELTSCITAGDAYNDSEIYALGGAGVDDHAGGAHNRRDLDALHPEMKKKVNALISAMKARGFDTQIITTWRSPQSQAQLRLENKSKTSFGYHNFVDATGAAASQAADLVDKGALYGPDNPSSDPAAHEQATRYFKALGEEAQKLGLRWGGGSYYQKSNPLWAQYGMGWDPAHVELTSSPGEDLFAAKQIAANLRII